VEAGERNLLFPLEQFAQAIAISTGKTHVGQRKPDLPPSSVHRFRISTR